MSSKNDPRVKPDQNLFFENRIASKWLNTKEAAAFLRLTENAVRIMVHRDQIPAFKFGNRLRFKIEDLENLFAKRGSSHGY